MEIDYDAYIEKGAEGSSRFYLLPVYLVLDTSTSMAYYHAFEPAFEFLPKIMNEMIQSVYLSSKIRLELITFDVEAKVQFELGAKEDLQQWLRDRAHDPLRPEGTRTYYGEAFRLLRERIEEGERRIRQETHNGEAYMPNRPAVFFITDGEPNDLADAREQFYRELTAESFMMRPNIVCVGVADAKMQHLQPYGAGRFNTPDNRYSTGNSDMVLIARDGVPIDVEMKNIVKALVQSVVGSLSGTGMNSDGGYKEDDENEFDPFTTGFATVYNSVDNSIFDVFEEQP